MNQQQERVIVWDGTGHAREGTLVRPNPALHAEEAHGRIITLPTEERMFGATALGGLFMRAWGMGVRFTGLRPQRGCPMALHITTDVPYLHWAARIEKLDRNAEMRGTIAVVGTNEPVMPMVGTLSATGRPIDLASFGEPDERGGWFIRGRLQIRTPIDGLCPLIFQAVADNLVIRWTALTQSRSEE